MDEICVCQLRIVMHSHALGATGAFGVVVRFANRSAPGHQVQERPLDGVF